MIITGPGGSRRLFQPDSRKASYFAQPGDSGTLVALGGGAYKLQESNGTVLGFRADGKLDYIQDTHGLRITCVYEGSLLKVLNHSAGPSLTLAYTASNTLQSITDSLGRATLFEFDTSGQHLISATDYRGLKTQYAYSTGQGPAREHALTAITKPDSGQITFTYNAQGRLISRAGSCTGGSAIGYTYNTTGIVTATDALNHSSQSFYDHRGLLLRVADALGNVSERAYDSVGKLISATDAAGRSVTYQYDPRGNVLAETDALGYTTRYTFTGSLNQLASVTDANGNLTSYAYETDGDLQSITDDAGYTESWTYDTQGNRLTWRNKRGQVITYINDSLGRVIERRYPDGRIDTFAYDRGNLTRYTDPTGTTTQEFDANDRLIKITYPGGQWLAYTYDSAGRRATMTDQLGHKSKYFYDPLGRMAALKDENDAEIVRYEYDAVGRMTQKTLNGNGIYTTYSYDAADQLTELCNCRPDGSILSRFVYTYDSRGRRTSMTTTYGAGDTRAAGLWDYKYDDTGQLIEWTAPDGRDVKYRYDGLGNRLSVTENNVDTIYVVNDLNQYTTVGSTAYEYDADGNMTEKSGVHGVTTYTWSADNKLTRVATPGLAEGYSYNAAGYRTSIDSSGTVTDFVIDPTGLGNMVSEYNHANSALIACYKYGEGLLSACDGTASTRCYTFDALGSTSETVVGASVANALTYLPFGGRVTQGASVDEPFQFVGELGVITDGTFLSFMRARYYGGTLGRFLSPDPIGLSGGDVNLYRYVFNGPTLKRDPAGFEASCTYPSSCDEEFVCCKIARVDGKVVSCTCTCGACPPEGQCPKGMHPNSDGTGCVGPGDGGQAKGPKRCDVAVASQGSGASGEGACDNGGGKDGGTTGPSDPNDLLGPDGYGPQRFVAKDALLPYTVRFENDPKATAPAQSVLISNPLPANLDPSTFALTGIGFGDYDLDLPPETQHYQNTISMTYNGRTFNVEIEAGIDQATGTVFARFSSLDPATELPPDVLTGFLPPEDGTGRGMGFVRYIIRPRAGLSTGTGLKNIAYISFDGQPAIATNQVDPHDASKGTDPAKEAPNTIDGVAPDSSVNPLPATTNAKTFVVSWTAADDTAASGVGSYDLYYVKDGGPIALATLWLNRTPDTSAVFTAEGGHSYGFFSVARDNAGNVEDFPLAADTTTTVLIPPPPVPVSDSYTITENGTLIVSAASGVLANDTGDAPLSIAPLTNPRHGTLTLRADGSFDYHPGAHFNGTDTFTYLLTSGIGTTAEGTVTINVQADTAAPPAAANLAITPDTGASATDGITNRSLVSLSGRLPGPGEIVALRDMTAGIDLGTATVNGSDFAANLNLTAPGLHHIRVRNSDSAGLYSDSFFDIFIDHASPMVLNVLPISSTPAGADGFSVQFSEDARVAAMVGDGSIASAISLFRMVGATPQPVALSAGVFSFSAANARLDWRAAVPAALPMGTYRIVLTTSQFTDTAGNTLGGTDTAIQLGAEQRVKAGAADLQVTAYSVPALGDWNNDGLADLLVGEKIDATSGKVRVYLNTGTPLASAFDSFTYVQAGGTDLSIPATGCLGAFPRFVDWDRDGRNDLLIGLADGTVRFYRNTGTAAAPVLANGINLQAGDSGSKALIDVGERATIDVVDWNNDGAADLVLGALDGKVRVYLNRAAAGEPDLASPITVLEGSTDLQVASGRSSVDVVDFNGDGRKDLILGNTDAQLWFYANAGTDAAPVFTTHEELLALAGGFRSRPFVADVNGDGVVDLLLGAADGLVRLYAGERAADLTATLQVSTPQDSVAGMEGPAGFGTGGSVNATADLSYRVFFTHQNTAAAPVQSLSIRNPLSPHHDPATFALTEIAVGSQRFTFPANTQLVDQTTSMTWNGVTFNVHIVAGLEASTGTVYARFDSVDPGTGLPPDLSVGFLPPDDGSGRGTGWVRYTAKSRTGLPTGTQIRSVASVVFDGQPAIATNQVDPHDPTKGSDPAKECLNTIDATPPKVISAYYNQMTPVNVGPVNYLVVRFNEDVQSSLNLARVQVRNITLGQDVTPGSFVYDAASNSAVFCFPVGTLTDGNYSLTLSSPGITDGVGNPLDGNGDGSGGDSYVFTSPDFFELFGDINRDRKVDSADVQQVQTTLGTRGIRPEDGDANSDGEVNFIDLVLVAQNYGRTGTTLLEGDVTNDGTTDFIDLVRVAQNYNSSGRADLNRSGLVDQADLDIVNASLGHTLPLAGAPAGMTAIAEQGGEFSSPAVAADYSGSAAVMPAGTPALPAKPAENLTATATANTFRDATPAPITPLVKPTRRVIRRAEPASPRRFNSTWARPAPSGAILNRKEDTIPDGQSRAPVLPPPATSFFSTQPIRRLVLDDSDVVSVLKSTPD